LKWVQSAWSRIIFMDSLKIELKCCQQRKK
jgi:hypothetical protein